MTQGEPALIEHIRQTIKHSGPVTFAWFMKQALYHPEHGYYSSGRCTIGRRGDYFTSVSVGPLFGRLLAAQFAEMWTMLGRLNEFSIVEQGAHEGAFACDVLEAAREYHPEFFRALRYEIVEPFPILRTRQRETLQGHAEKVTWHDSLAALPDFDGVHFSNELLDAMPVHLLKWTGTEWLERHIAERDGSFAFVDLPLSSPELARHLRGIAVPLPPGYETEINLDARAWISALSRKVTQGFIVIADYGFAQEEFYAPHRITGSVRAYARHQVVPSPLNQIGLADITAHVEWTGVAEQAQASGLMVAGFTDQHQFITGLLAGDPGQKLGSNPGGKMQRALQTLLHPGFLGMKFQFLVLAKKVEKPAAISGLRFARDAHAALGLAPRCVMPARQT